MIIQKKVKCSDNGFSLVELIVVVLIMGILAVGLTPQVLKWVNNARKANDMDYMHNLEAAIQLALLNADVVGEVIEEVDESGSALVLIVDSSGTKDPINDGEDSALLKKTADILGFGTDTTSFKKHATRVKGGEIRISITGGHAVGKYSVYGSSIDFEDE